MLIFQSAAISKKTVFRNPTNKKRASTAKPKLQSAAPQKPLQKMKFLCFPAADLTNCRKYSKIEQHAGMAELADAPDLGSGV